MKQINILVISILVVFVFACGSTKTESAEDNIYSNWNMYSTNNYSIHYPKTWRLDTSGYQGTIFSIFSRQKSLLDKFIENVSLKIIDLDDFESNLSEYIELVEKKIKAEAIDSLLLESESLSSNGIDFQKIIYKKRHSIYIVKFEQYYWLRGNKIYTLTLSCRENEFNNYKKTGEKILNSLKFK